MHLLRWFNREKITLLIASLALALGAVFPWYRLPPQALETFGINLSLVNAGRVLVALFALLGFAFTFCFSLNRAPRLPLWSGLIVVLLFPYLISTWFPSVNFLAASYYDQGTRVSQYIDKNFSQVQAQWKQNIQLDQAKPIKTIFNFSIKDSRFFQISSWDCFLIGGLGYSNSFFGFIGRGWGFAVVGFAIGLLALYLGLESNNFDLFITDLGKIMPWVGLLIGALVFSMILPNFMNFQLNTMLAKGEYRQAVAISQILISLYPPLSGDATFLQHLAEAGFYAQKPDSGLLYFAKGLERYASGDLLKAEDYFQRSLDIEPSHFLVRGYLAAASLSQGVNYFNNPDIKTFNQHKPGAAADRFEEALRIFPGHIEALYDLMLARVVDGEFEKSAVVAQQIIETQQYPQNPNLSLLAQAYVHSAWASYRNGDTTQAWKQYRQSIDSNTWKQSDSWRSQKSGVRSQEKAYRRM